MVRNRRQRIRNRRRPMRERGRTKRRFSRRSHIDLPSSGGGQRAVVLGGQFHEQVVWMLPVMDGVAVTYLAGREQIRITTPANRPRLRTQHGAERELTGSEGTLCGPHGPV